MLASRVRQSISGAGPTSFTLIDDTATTGSRTIVTAYGSGSSKPGLFTIVDTSVNQWAVVEGYATAGSPDSFTVSRTLRASDGTSNNQTWAPGTKTIFAGECADLLALLCQCPTTAGTGTAYTLALGPAPLALVNSSEIKFIAHAACGAAPTLAINGLAAWPLRKGSGATALAAGDIPAGAVVTVMPEVASSRFRVLSISTEAIGNNSRGTIASGYMTLADGFMLQFGSTTLTGNQNVIFPIAFPSTVKFVSAVPTTTSNTTYTVNIGTVAVGSFGAYPSSGGAAVTLAVFWLAIGN